MKVLVHGRLHYTKWTDATGMDRYGCEIVAEKVDFLGRPKSAEGQDPELVDRDDKIPFLGTGSPQSPAEKPAGLWPCARQAGQHATCVVRQTLQTCVIILAEAIASMATMNVSLPAPMKVWVEAQTQDGRYGNASDYVRDLIRWDQDRQQSIAEWQQLASEGLASGPVARLDVEAILARKRDKNARTEGH